MDTATRTPHAGDKVRVHYTGRLDDGTVFDSSRERDALEFTVGKAEVIPGFDDAVTSLGVGRSTTVRIPVARAYGPRRDDLVVRIPRDRFPPDLDPAVGEILEARSPLGDVAQVVVAEVDAESVTIDANHPLAGHDLVFDIELVEIV